LPIHYQLNSDVYSSHVHDSEKVLLTEDVDDKQLSPTFSCQHHHNSLVHKLFSWVIDLRLVSMIFKTALSGYNSPRGMFKGGSSNEVTELFE